MSGVQPDRRKILRIEARNSATPIEKKPEWIRVRARLGPEYLAMANSVRHQGSHTMRQEADCPSIFEYREDREAPLLVGTTRTSVGAHQ